MIVSQFGLSIPTKSSDWREARIGDLLTVRHGKSQWAVQNDDGEYPIWASGGQIGWASRPIYDRPSVLIGRKGTIDQPRFVDRPFWSIDTLFFTEVKSSNDPKFMYYLFCSIPWRQYNEASGVPSLNRSVIESILVRVPEKQAQVRIAKALSDIDSLIESLDQLIAKKRDVMRGAMQQLLNGNTRLPGFIEDWEMKRLGDPDVSVIVSGGTPSTNVPSFWNGDIPWATPTDITSTPGKYLYATDRTITLEGLESCSTQMLPTGSLLLCSRATVGEVRIATTPICTNQGFKSLVVPAGTSNEFLYYLLQTLKPQLLERSFGSTFLELPTREAVALPVRLPSFLEQKSIATILSDMDAEIEGLEDRRKKTMQIKQGMMSELLTGKTRLL